MAAEPFPAARCEEHDHGVDETAGTDGGSDRAVGDPDRAAADAELQAAVGRGALSLGDYEDLARSVWEVRTRGELAAVTADLVVDRPPVAAVPATREPRRTVAVMSESQFSGAVLPGQPVHATAVMGTVVVDLRRTDLPHDVQVRAVTVMGEVTVLVPRGVQVHLGGAAVMGSRTSNVGPAEPGAPVVTVTASALMGSVTITHGSTEAPAGAGRGVDLEKGRGRVGRQRPHRSGGWPLKRIVTVVAVAAAAYGAIQVVGADHSTVFSSDTVTQTESGTVDVGVLFGSEKVVVPDNAVVTKDSNLIFGSTTCNSACTPGRTGGPAITVQGAGAFGSVRVLTVTEATADRNNR